MQDIQSLIQVSESFKTEINKAILAGIADADSDRVTDFNKKFSEDLKSQLRSKLASK